MIALLRVWLKFRPTQILGWQKEKLSDSYFWNSSFSRSRQDKVDQCFHHHHHSHHHLVTSLVTASNWLPKMSITMLSVLRGNHEVKKITLTLYQKLWTLFFRTLGTQICYKKTIKYICTHLCEGMCSLLCHVRVDKYYYLSSVSLGYLCLKNR